uniref:Phytoene dehydrogenase n=2 Tax=Rhizophora mucronata TaxID=61149 RepID=A0A2P2MG25_RHIMU
MDLLRTKGCRFLHNRKLMDFFIDEETGCISDLVCSNEIYKADAVILAVGVSTIQEIIKDSAALCTSKEFLKVLKLAGIDVLSAKLFLDRKVNIPQASNACSGNDDSFGWTFFNLNALHDEHKESPVTVIQADFYYASELLRLGDDEVVKKVMTCLSQCIKDFETASVMDKQIERFPKSMTHFFPGSYKHMMRGSTSFPNLFAAGDWIKTRHGSWGQEKSYVTGLEAANRVVDFLGDGNFAKIIPVEEDEPHIQALRSLNRSFNEIRTQLPFSGYFLQ